MPLTSSYFERCRNLKPAFVSVEFTAFAILLSLAKYYIFSSLIIIVINNSNYLKFCKPLFVEIIINYSIFYRLYTDFRKPYEFFACKNKLHLFGNSFNNALGDGY